jgi:hypothetical protein
MTSKRLDSTMAYLILAFLIQCSDSPSSPDLASTAPAVSDPQVLVGGVSVRGPVMAGTDQPAVFGVRVHAPSGLPSIRRVVLQYSQPGPNHHGGPMMGGYNGTTLCYDDGTHGDDVAGDGIYHFMDPDQNIGCHGIGAPPGEYHYSFWCEDIHGQRSNTASLTITRQ